MARLISPKSIAIVGATPNSHAFASHTVRNNRDFDGQIYLVNAKYERIGDENCYPTVAALPEVPDCVVIAVGREGVTPIVEDCANCGVGGVVLYASGYAETKKPDRIAQQEHLSAIARASGMRIAGPNCVGVINHVRRLALTFSPEYALCPPGEATVGVVSQSGGVGNALTQTLHVGTVFSHMLTAGNSCDVDIADYVAYLAEDSTCRSIACIFEGMEDPGRLIEACEIAWSAGKPLVIFKLGSGDQGAAAAMSHTGMLAGSHAAYLAAFERTGAIVATTYQSFMETASFFAKAPPPTGKGIGVITSSGGFAVLAADTAEKHGVPLPQPAGRTLATLQKHVPEFGAARNPCDVTAQATNEPSILLESTDALLADPEYSAVIFLHAYAFSGRMQRMMEMRDLAKVRGKMLGIVWLPGWLEGPGSKELENDPGIALFRSMESCFATMAAWHHRENRRREQLDTGPRQRSRLSDAGASSSVAALLESTVNKTLTERESKSVLARYGVPVIDEILALTADQAARSARAIGFPVAIKVESPDIPHKTDAGVIRLNLADEDAVKNAFQAIMSNAEKVIPSPRINGAIVQRMIPTGVEIMIGARIDPQFGPLVVVGLGGIFVELLRDTAMELAPVTHAEALAMLSKLKGRTLLEGFRGSMSVDVGALADIVVRVSEFASDQRTRISELDINPLICSGSSILAVDALIVRR